MVDEYWRSGSILSKIANKIEIYHLNFAYEVVSAIDLCPYLLRNILRCHLPDVLLNHVALPCS